MKKLEEFIIFINNNLVGDIEKDTAFFCDKLLSGDKKLTIDEAVVVLKRCKKLNNVIKHMIDENVYIKNSTIIDAYNMMNEEKLSSKYDKYNSSSLDFDLDSYLASGSVHRPKDIDLLRLYLSEISRYPLLTKDEVNKLFIAIENGDENAKQVIANHNLKLVVSIAKGYRDRGVDFSDLIQDGNIGLMKAINKFNYKLGYNFSTYATWWIRQSVARSIDDNALTVRVPVHVNETVNRIRGFLRAYEVEYGGMPSDELLMETFNIPEQKIDLYKKIATKTYITSLDIPVKASSDSDANVVLGDFVESKDNELENIDDKIFYNDLINDIKKCDLPEKYKRILFLRYGIEDGKRHTLEEIGKMMGLTRERIRQIEVKSIQKIKHSILFRKYNPEDGQDVEKPYTMSRHIN